jgi:hypothetical protein
MACASGGESVHTGSRGAPSTPIESRGKGFSELVRAGCEDYVLKGIGLPIAAYLFHAVKLCLFVLGWMFFVRFTPGLGSPWEVGSWWREGIAFQKAFLWACLVEVLGFGCMSGPLGFRIWPPFTAFLHFLRPGTTKLAPFRNLPVFGGTTRTWLDVALYAAFVASLVRALVAPQIGAAQLVPVVVLLPLCALADKTIVLAARVEHHFAMIVCFLLAENWIAGCKAVQLAIWFWAGVSKLTVAFGYVIPVMTLNNPLVKSPSVRRRMFVSYPDDLRPSRLGRAMAHAGTFLEFAAPLTLLFVTGPGPRHRLGAARDLPDRRAHPAAAHREPRPQPGLLPGRDALLRRQLGVERLALPRRQPPQARPREARLAAPARAARALCAGRGGEHGLARHGVPFAAPPGPVPGSPAPEGDGRTLLRGVQLRRRRERRRLRSRLELRGRAPG